MSKVIITLGEIAHARSGDKGSMANIGVIAYSEEGYQFLKGYLTADKVDHFFKPMGVSSTQRYELLNLHAFNFILQNILLGGGSRSLRIDAQGKALGQVLLQMPIEIPREIYEKAKRQESK
jgi:hypothetical protein